MKSSLYVQLAPIQLKEGVDEATLLEASETFQTHFVSKQEGVVKRVLMRAKHGYADLVFFRSKEDADRVAQAEATSEHCLEFFKLMKAPDETLHDMGVLSFEHMKTYE